MSAIDLPTQMLAIRDWVWRSAGLDEKKVFWYYDGGDRPKAPFIELSIESIGQVAHDWTITEDNPLVFSDVTVTADHATSQLHGVDHGLLTGDGAIRLTTTGVIPTGLAVDKDYWLIKIDADHVQVAETFFNAMGDPTRVPVTFSDDGTGTLKIVQTTRSERVGEELKRTVQGFREVSIRMQCFALPGTVHEAVSRLADVITALPLHIDALDAAGLGISDLGAASPEGIIKSVEGRRGLILEPRAIVDITAYVTATASDFINYIQRIKLTIDAQQPDGSTIASVPVTILQEE